MSDDITAPSVGSATTAKGIADELNEACEALRTVDYNALTPEQLGDVLAAFNTLEDMCRHFRDRQHTGRGRHREQDEDEEVVDLGEEHGEAEPTDE